MTLTLDSILVASRDHLASDLPDETIILNLPRGRYFGVNGVAREIWQMLQRPTSVREMRDAIAQRYGRDPQEVERDLYHFLDELQSNALVSVNPS